MGFVIKKHSDRSISYNSRKALEVIGEYSTFGMDRNGNFEFMVRGEIVATAEVTHVQRFSNGNINYTCELPVPTGKTGDVGIPEGFMELVDKHLDDEFVEWVINRRTDLLRAGRDIGMDNLDKVYNAETTFRMIYGNVCLGIEDIQYYLRKHREVK